MTQITIKTQPGTQPGVHPMGISMEKNLLVEFGKTDNDLGHDLELELNRTT